MSTKTGGRPTTRPDGEAGGKSSEAADGETRERTHILSVADALFYAYGIQAVGMDRIRDASGVSLKRLYRFFPSKAVLVEAYLRRRDAWARGALGKHVTEVAESGSGSPREQILAVFDWLYAWAKGPDFHGCAFLNAYGELASGSERVANAVRDHKSAVYGYLRDLAEATTAPDPGGLAAQLSLLLDGAMSGAHVSGSAAPALDARAVAATLLDASGAGSPAPA